LKLGRWDAGKLNGICNPQQTTNNIKWKVLGARRLLALLLLYKDGSEMLSFNIFFWGKIYEIPPLAGQSCSTRTLKYATHNKQLTTNFLRRAVYVVVVPWWS